MGVTTYFINVYNSEQFEIVGIDRYTDAPLKTNNIPGISRACLKSHLEAGKEGPPRLFIRKVKDFEFSHIKKPIAKSRKKKRYFTAKQKTEFKRVLFAIQQGICFGCGAEKHKSDFHLDHVDSYGPSDLNIAQLLCMRCNTVKGDKDMSKDENWWFNAQSIKFQTDFETARSEASKNPNLRLWPLQSD